jgi:hypothetical protein
MISAINTQGIFTSRYIFQVFPSLLVFHVDAMMAYLTRFTLLYCQLAAKMPWNCA